MIFSHDLHRVSPSRHASLRDGAHGISHGVSWLYSAQTESRGSSRMGTWECSKTYFTEPSEMAVLPDQEKGSAGGSGMGLPDVARDGEGFDL